MCKKRQKLMLIDMPLFSVASYKEFVLISGGGGGKKYGLQNRILVYKRQPFEYVLKDIVLEYDTKLDMRNKFCLDKFSILEHIYTNIKCQIFHYKSFISHIIERIQPHPSTKTIISNSNENCVIFKIQDNGQFQEVYRMQTDFKHKESCQNDGKLNHKGDLLATGGEDGTVRLWTVQHNGQNGIKVERQCEFSFHTNSINNVDFHSTSPLLISSSDDQTCRIYNIEKQILVQKLNIVNEKNEGFKFQSAYFSNTSNLIYTIQNPYRQQPSFLNVWQMEDKEIKHQKDIKLHSMPISASSINSSTTYLGIGGCDGCCKIVNLNNQTVQNSQHNQLFVVRGVDFTSDSQCLISVTPEMSVDIIKNDKSQGLLNFVFKNFSILFLIALIIYSYFGIQNSQQ